MRHQDLAGSSGIDFTSLKYGIFKIGIIILSVHKTIIILQNERAQSLQNLFCLNELFLTLCCSVTAVLSDNLFHFRKLTCARYNFALQMTKRRSHTALCFK